MNDTDQKVQELEDKLDKMEADHKKEKDDLEQRLLKMEKIIKTHGHAGELNDGTKPLEREIDLLPGQTIGVGGVSALGGGDDPDGNRTLVIVATGRDTNPKDGISNSQIYMEHQYGTDGTTNSTFFQGIRAPIYGGSTAVIKSGASTMSQTDFSWDVNSLIGAYVVANAADGSTFGGYPITANTANTLTISGTWSFSGQLLSYTVFMPIYLGSASFPWRRVYTGDLTSGGVRFGYGATAGGQNGLLYMDATGDLYWRNKTGTSTKLN